MFSWRPPSPLTPIPSSERFSKIFREGPNGDPATQGKEAVFWLRVSKVVSQRRHKRSSPCVVTTAQGISLFTLWWLGSGDCRPVSGGCNNQSHPLVIDLRGYHVSKSLHSPWKASWNGDQILTYRLSLNECVGESEFQSQIPSEKPYPSNPFQHSVATFVASSHLQPVLMVYLFPLSSSSALQRGMGRPQACIGHLSL